MIYGKIEKENLTFELKNNAFLLIIINSIIYNNQNNKSSILHLNDYLFTHSNIFTLFYCSGVLTINFFYECKLV